MEYKVVARQSGNSVKFTVEASDTKTALHEAKSEANIIFGYKTGDAVIHVVSVKPVVEKD